MSDQQDAATAVEQHDDARSPAAAEESKPQEQHNGHDANTDKDADKVLDAPAAEREQRKDDHRRHKDDDHKRRESKSRRCSRSRSRRRSRSRDRRRRRSRSRDRRRSRDRKRRSRSRPRHRSRSYDRRRRSRSRDRRRSRSRDRHRRRRRSASSSDDGMGGYRPRRRADGAVLDPLAVALANQASFVDPMIAIRANQPPPEPVLSGEELAKQRREQQLNARLMILVQQAKSAVLAVSKPHREQVYVGNLPPNSITEEMLRELFTSTIRAALPDTPPDLDPVPLVTLGGPEKRYAFIDVATQDMSMVVLGLSGQVQLLGQTITISRPTGFVERDRLFDTAKLTSTALAQFQAARMLEAGDHPTEDGSSTTPTAMLYVEGLVQPPAFKDDDAFNKMVEQVKEECNKYGMVIRVYVPRPSTPAAITTEWMVDDIGRALVQYLDPDTAASALEAINNTGLLAAGFVHPVHFLKRQGLDIDPTVMAVV